MSSSWSEYFDQSGGSLALFKVQSSRSNSSSLSWLSAIRTDFDHRSLEGILLIVVQCKHAALSHCHGNDVTSVYGTHACHPRRPGACACALGNTINGRETRTIERREQSHQQRNMRSGGLMYSVAAVLPDCANSLTLACPALEDVMPFRQTQSPVRRYSLGGWRRDKRDMTRPFVSDLRCLEV